MEENSFEGRIRQGDEPKGSSESAQGHISPSSNANKLYAAHNHRLLFSARSSKEAQARQLKLALMRRRANNMLESQSLENKAKYEEQVKKQDLKKRQELFDIYQLQKKQQVIKVLTKKQSELALEALKRKMKAKQLLTKLQIILLIQKEKIKQKETKASNLANLASITQSKATIAKSIKELQQGSTKKPETSTTIVVTGAPNTLASHA